MLPIKPLKVQSRVYNTGKTAELTSGVRLPILVTRSFKGDGYRGECYDAADVAGVVVKLVNSGFFFKRRIGAMTDPTKQATETLDSAVDGFAKSIERFDNMQVGFVDKSKRAAGNVRDAAEKLAQGIERVEKAANFERLERYVLLLERAATAMTMLADLEAKGKLEKIASAIR